MWNRASAIKKLGAKKLGFFPRFCSSSRLLVFIHLIAPSLLPHWTHSLVPLVVPPISYFLFFISYFRFPVFRFSVRWLFLYIYTHHFALHPALKGSFGEAKAEPSPLASHIHGRVPVCTHPPRPSAPRLITRYPRPVSLCPRFPIPKIPRPDSQMCFAISYYKLVSDTLLSLALVCIDYVPTVAAVYL
jgi:hypothetical protein